MKLILAIIVLSIFYANPVTNGANTDYYRSTHFIVDKNVQFKYIPLSSSRIPTTFGIFLSLAIFLFCAAFILDARDTSVQPIIYLVDNRPEEEYKYVVIVFTGNLFDAGTSSYVGIKLHGINGSSKRHILHGIQAESILQRNSVNWFMLTTSHSLGVIQSVELWHNSEGNSPEWFLDRIVVRDLIYGLEFVFNAGVWFSLTRDDGKIHRKLNPEDQRFSDYVRKTFLEEEFEEHHIWLGMLSRQYSSTLSRCQKCISVILFGSVVGLWLILWYGIRELQTNGVVDEGDIHVDEIVKFGMLGAIVGSVVTHVSVWFFQLSFGTPNQMSLSMSSMTFVMLTILTTYTFCPQFFDQSLVITGVSIFALYLFSTTFGVRKSKMWQASFILAVLCDIVIIETIFVLLRTFILRFIVGGRPQDAIPSHLVDLNVIDQKPFANTKMIRTFLTKEMYYPLTFKVRMLKRYSENNFYRFRTKFYDSCWYLLFGLLMLPHFFTYYQAPTSYLNEIALKNVFETPFYLDSMPLNKVFDDDDFYSYVNDTILKSVHSSNDNWLINHVHKLVGVPRLRQLRLRPDEHCTKSILRKAFNGCDPLYSTSTLDHIDYAKKWKLLDKNERERHNFNYRSDFEDVFDKTGSQDYLDTFENYVNFDDPEEFTDEIFTIDKAYRFFSGFDYSRKFLVDRHHSYPDTGYQFFFKRNNLYMNQLLLLGLQHYNWIDNHTRVIFYEIVTANANANQIQLTTIIFFRTIPYQNAIRVESMPTFDYELLGYKFVFGLLFAIAATGFFIKFACLHQTNDQGKWTFWSRFDLCLGILLLSYVLFDLLQIITLEVILSKKQTYPAETYIDVTGVFMLRDVNTVLSSLIVFLIVVRLIKVLQIFDFYSVLVHTFRLLSLLIFIGFFVVLFIASLILQMNFGDAYECLSTSWFAFLCIHQIPFGGGIIDIHNFTYDLWLSLILILVVMSLYICVGFVSIVIVWCFVKAKCLINRDQYRINIVDYARAVMFTDKLKAQPHIGSQTAFE